MSMKLEIIEPSDRDSAILIGDEDHNDIAEFYHNEHATVEQSYETALTLARKLVADVNRPFYGAECPSYPACSGGCGLGCTHEVERASPLMQIKRLALDCKPADVPAALAHIVRICIDAERAGPAATPLDQAWDKINALGGSEVQDNSYDQGIVDTVRKALEVIEALGGADPKTRAPVSRPAPNPPAATPLHPMTQQEMAAKWQAAVEMAEQSLNEVERLRNLMRAMLDQLPIGATITFGGKVLDHDVLSIIRNEIRAAVTHPAPNPPAAAPTNDQDLVKELADVAESILLRERNSIIEECAKVADKEADLLLFTGARLNSFSGATKLHYSEAELHEQAGTAIKVAVDKIRALAVTRPNRGEG